MAILFGLLLMGVAVAVPNAAVEGLLLGRSTGGLSWGPTLFRVLLALHGVVLIGFSTLRRRAGSSPREAPREPDGMKGSSDKTPAWIWASLVGLTIVGGFLRLWKVGAPLWFDEIDTVVHILREPISKIVTSYSSQNQHMFYSVLARICVTVFGEGPFAARLPSVVFGLLSIWALFFLARRIAGPSLGLLASSLLTFSYHHVWFSQNARGYMGLLFFTLLATWLLLEAWDGRGIGWWIGYACALALGSWIHMTMVLVAVSQAGVFVLAEIANRPRGGIPLGRRLYPLAAWVFAGTLTLQLYALALPEFIDGSLRGAARASEWTNPVWMVNETIRNLAGAGPFALSIVAVGGLVMFLGWWRIVRKQGAAAWMMALPGMTVAVTMFSFGHNLWPRFFFFSMGFGILFLIIGVQETARVLTGRILSEAGAKQLGTAVVILMIIGSAATVPRNYAHPKQDFVGARDFVEEEMEPGDGVVGVGLAGIAYDLFYAPRWGVAQTVEELEKALSEHERLWVVYTLPIEVRNGHPGMMELIQARFERIRVFPGTLGGGDVAVWRTRPS